MMTDIIENLTTTFYHVIRDNCSEELNDFSWDVLYIDLQNNNFREIFNSLYFNEYSNLHI